VDGRQGGDDAGRTRDLWLLELLDEDWEEEETYCRHYEVLADHVEVLPLTRGHSVEALGKQLMDRHGTQSQS
jgi:hypothetical protein